MNKDIISKRAMALKKILSIIAVILLIVLLTGGILIFDRFKSNKELFFPYPYDFPKGARAIAVDAPILIVGDRMGENLARYKAEMANVISKNLSKPIKIQSMAKSGLGLHRSLHDLESLIQWPQIVIYHGASEEMKEIKFRYDQIPLIKENFHRYSDPMLATIMMVLPWSSRIIYDPILRLQLPNEPKLADDIEEKDYLIRLDTEILLFEQQLIHLVNLSKDRNSLLILTTTPINLEVQPKKVCSFTTTVDIQIEFREIEILVELNDLKSAFTRSTKLIQTNSGNAMLFYQHGMIAKLLGRPDEAKKSFAQASAFDCTPWRATEIQNSIIRRVARAHQVLLFDFALLVESNGDEFQAFFDELYPQNIYYEKASEQLGIVVREILKL